MFLQLVKSGIILAYKLKTDFFFPAIKRKCELSKYVRMLLRAEEGTGEVTVTWLARLSDLYYDRWVGTKQLKLCILRSEIRLVYLSTTAVSMLRVKEVKESRSDKFIFSLSQCDAHGKFILQRKE